MAYKSGELRISGQCPEPDSFGCPHEPEHESVHDSRLPLGHPLEYKDLFGQAYLPHSCNEWVIGGAEEIRALIADLHAALAAVEQK